MTAILKKYFFLPACAVLLLVMAEGVLQLSLGGQAAKDEGRGQIVILKSTPTGIAPDSLTIAKGETIVWINKDPEPVKIKFKQPLGLACSAPVNFYADLLGNYETGKITQGSTASICLVNAGNFDYEVHRLVKKEGREPYEEINAGRIIVQ